eukprot:gene14619-10188_t
MVRVMESRQVQRFAAERVTKLMEDEVFSRAKQAVPGCEKKVKAVRGDIGADRLGMSDEDRAEVAEKVTILIHIAATVRFQERLKNAINLNIKGVKRMIELAHDLKQCDSFVHCSTAYTHAYKTEIGEELYPPTYDVDKLLEITSMVDDEMVDMMTPKLIEPHPNTYTFTKCLGEHCVRTELGDIPFSVVRPAIVTAAWKEPFVGWTDNMNGPNGLALMVGAGLCRVLRGKPEVSPNLVPIDTVANYLIAAAWYTATTAESGKVYNCVNAHNMTTWKNFADGIVKWFKKYPLESKMFRVPKVDVLGHTCYAKMGDGLLALLGQKPFASRAYSKLEGFSDVLGTWLNNQWVFEEGNGERAMELMSDEDKRTYNVSCKNLHWNTYMQNYILGLKTYVAKEKDAKKSTKGRANMRKIFYFDLAMRISVSAFLIRMLSSIGLLKKRSTRMTWLMAALFANSTRFFQEWSIAAWNLIFKVSKKPLLNQKYTRGTSGGAAAAAAAAGAAAPEKK